MLRPVLRTKCTSSAGTERDAGVVVMLGLHGQTKSAWAPLAVRHLPELLADHAHCELKAATNALSVATRWADCTNLVRAMAELAEEEMSHFREVLAVIHARGWSWSKPQVDSYAEELRAAAASSRHGRSVEARTDRLLIGALIEARSCERLRLLADAFQEIGEVELSAFYLTLFASEAKHHVLFTQLAEELAGVEPVAVRLRELQLIEGQINARLGVAPRIHG